MSENKTVLQKIDNSPQGQLRSLLGALGVYNHFADKLVESIEKSGYERGRADASGEIFTELNEKLYIEINPSNENYMIWYRGLGREEGQRSQREKALSIVERYLKPIE